MIKYCTFFICLFASANLFAQAASIAKITLVERVTDADGKTVEKTVEKTGDEALAYLTAHPEIQAAKNGEILTKKVTITRKSIDPLTGQLKVERVVKVGAEAINLDLRKLYLDNDNTLQQNFFENSNATAGTQNIKVEKKQVRTQIANEDNNSEDVDVTIDQTEDAENRAYLGVVPADLPSPKGVVIDFILEESPAALADLREWDIITAVQGVPVRNALELQKALAVFGPKDKVLINYYRNAKMEQVTVVLAASDALGRVVPAIANAKNIDKNTNKNTIAARPKASVTAQPAANSEMPFKDFRTYPNPSPTGLFTIQCTLAPTDYLLIKVIDPLTGSEIAPHIVNNHKGEFVHHIDLQRQKAGNFTLSITHNGNIYTQNLEYKP